MVFRAVLAGCGSMAKGWLKALADAPELQGRVADRRACRSRPRRGGAAQGRVRPERRGDRHRPRCHADRDQARYAVRRGGARRPAATSCSTGLQPWLPRADRKADGDVAGRGPRIGGCRATAGKRPCRGAEPPLHTDGVRRIRADHRERRARRADRAALRLLHRRAFRRLPRCNGARAAARHGDPHLRCRALHVGQGRRSRSIATRPIPRGSWYAHGAAANAIFEFTDDVVFTYRGSWAAEGANTSWEAPGASSAPRARCSGTAQTGFTAQVVDGDEGFFRPLREVRGPAARAIAAPDPRPCQRHRRFPRRDRDAAARPKPSAPTTSRASPWCSPPSKAPRTRQRVLIAA